MERHRLFFALTPDEGVRRQILEVAAALPDAGGRATRPEKIHLTLAFLGDADPGGARAAGARAAADTAAFDFELDEVDGFHGGIRILRARAEAFAPLVFALLRELRRAGVPSRGQAREFIPHVTLWRRDNLRLARAPITPIPWPARELCLYDSHLDTGEHERIGSWPLC
jgi:2'-5' RNA ligase